MSRGDFDLILVYILIWHIFLIIINGNIHMQHLTSVINRKQETHNKTRRLPKRK